jgi:hypothetical protein
MSAHPSPHHPTKYGAPVRAWDLVSFLDRDRPGTLLADGQRDPSRSVRIEAPTDADLTLATSDCTPSRYVVTCRLPGRSRSRRQRVYVERESGAAVIQARYVRLELDSQVCGLANLLAPFSEQPEVRVLSAARAEEVGAPLEVSALVAGVRYVTPASTLYAWLVNAPAVFALTSPPAHHVLAPPPIGSPAYVERGTPWDVTPDLHSNE